MDINRLKSKNGMEYFELDTPIQFILVGSSGVGKTSLLVSLYAQMMTFGCLGVFLPREEKYADVLSEKLEEMRQSLSGKTGVFGGIEKTDDVCSFAYELVGNVKNRRFVFPVCFKDIPGGYYKGGKLNDADRKEFRDIFKASKVFMICIDAPSLMNKQDDGVTICSHFNQYLGSMTSENTGLKIIFIFCKSESYTFEDMVKRLRSSSYNGIIKKCIHKKIPVEATYIHTLGGVKFSHYNESNEPIFEIVGEYAPKNCEVPLLRTLEHSAVWIKTELEKKNSDFIQWIMNFFGLSQSDIAEEVIKQIAKELHCEKLNNKEHYWDLSKE